jgi:hypothetical protein
MKIPTLLRTAACVTGLAVASIPAAGASEVLFDGSGFMMGQQSFEDSLKVSGPGTLIVTLTNEAWPQPLASLNLEMSTPQGLLGAEMGPGTDYFQVAGAGSVFAQWFGTAQGPLDAGVFGVKIVFSPTSVVPLPASILLFLSGLALLAWQRREGNRAPKEGMPAAP